MKPFAYHLVIWSYGEVESSKTYPALRRAVEAVLTRCNPDWVDRGKIGLTACYEDETERRLDADLLRVKVELDMDALRAEVRAAIEADRQKQAEWLKTLTHTVTGSPWLCDYGEDEIVEQWTHERQWRWKLPDEIDWAALEAAL